MLVTFSTDVHADITMFGDVALTLLNMMGQSGTMPGAILAVDVPVALNKLKTAIHAEKATTQNKTPAPEGDSGESSVSLVHRALPLIDLLAAAEKAETDVMWKST